MPKGSKRKKSTQQTLPEITPSPTPPMVETVFDAKLAFQKARTEREVTQIEKDIITRVNAGYDVTVDDIVNVCTPEFFTHIFNQDFAAYLTEEGKQEERDLAVYFLSALKNNYPHTTLKEIFNAARDPKHINQRSALTYFTTPIAVEMFNACSWMLSSFTQETFNINLADKPAEYNTPFTSLILAHNGYLLLDAFPEKFTPLCRARLFATDSPVESKSLNQLIHIFSSNKQTADWLLENAPYVRVYNNFMILYYLFSNKELLKKAIEKGTIYHISNANLFSCMNIHLKNPADIERFLQSLKPVVSEQLRKLLAEIHTISEESRLSEEVVAKQKLKQEKQLKQMQKEHVLAARDPEKAKSIAEELEAQEAKEASLNPKKGKQARKNRKKKSANSTEKLEQKLKAKAEAERLTKEKQANEQRERARLQNEIAAKKALQAEQKRLQEETKRLREITPNLSPAPESLPTVATQPITEVVACEATIITPPKIERIVLPEEYVKLFDALQALPGEHVIVGSVPAYLYSLSINQAIRQPNDKDILSKLASPETKNTLRGTPHPSIFKFKHEQEEIDIYLTKDNETIAENMLTRDFTICALYINAHNEIVDATGYGFDDIKNRVLRTINNPQDCFKDPLCVLRAIKYMLAGFDHPVPELAAALHQWEKPDNCLMHLVLNKTAEHMLALNDDAAYVRKLHQYGLLEKLFDITLNENDINDTIAQLKDKIGIGPVKYPPLTTEDTSHCFLEIDRYIRHGQAYARDAKTIYPLDAFGRPLCVDAQGTICVVPRIQVPASFQALDLNPILHNIVNAKRTGIVYNAPIAYIIEKEYCFDEFGNPFIMDDRNCIYPVDKLGRILKKDANNNLQPVDILRIPKNMLDPFHPSQQMLLIPNQAHSMMFANSVGIPLMTGPLWRPNV